MIVFGDYECPFCAALEARLRELELAVCFRHFPVRSSHPRAQPAACAAEAARVVGVDSGSSIRCVGIADTLVRIERDILTPPWCG